MIKNILNLVKNRPVMVGAVLGIVTGCILIIAVFATGMTFGQRCATVAEQDSLKWQKCVHDMSKGVIKDPGELND